MSILVSVRCSECDKTFEVSKDAYEALGLASLPKSCPRCKRIEHAPSRRVVRRECLQEFGSVQFCLPKRWFELFVTGKKNLPTVRATLKGNPGSRHKQWKGRMDVYVSGVSEARAIPRYVKVRVMEVEYEASQKKGLSNSYRYLALDRDHPPAPGASEPMLVHAAFECRVTHSNGKRKILGSLYTGDALWHRSLRNFSKRGDLATLGALAIVSDVNPIEAIVHGEDPFYKRWPE